MSNDNVKHVIVQFPVLSILAIVFTTLKLCNVIAWSWWWVLSPLWLPFAFIGGIVAFAAICFLLAAIFH
jgi:hypothetical protein